MLFTQIEILYRRFTSWRSMYKVTVSLGAFTHFIL